MWDAIARDISTATGVACRALTRVRVGGGCISAAYRLEDGTRRYFVKTGAAGAHEMFAVEAAALAEIAATRTVRVPAPIAVGGDARAAWLVLEHVELRPLDARSAAALGERLAALHRHTAPAYGWSRDNTIGSTPQSNAHTGDWTAFWRERRLKPQFARAGANGHRALQQAGGRLMAGLDRFFAGHRPQASLLHGDLWCGNAGTDGSGAPVLFDPASYYGDREAELAMTELFGGFPSEFRAAYRSAWPVDRGYETRKTVYALYHVLNHLNLFGGAYLDRAHALTAEALARL